MDTAQIRPCPQCYVQDLTAKVLDFGLAKIHQSSTTAQGSSNSPTLSAVQTAGGVILGTAAYMSPEQARGKNVDQRTDVWAFGCLLYEMLTGRQAFPNGETISDTIAGILKGEPNWQALPISTPAGVRRLSQRCLRKEPNRRLHDMAEARIEIEEARSEHAAGPVPAPTTGVAASSQRRQLFWPVVAAVFLVTALSLILRITCAPAPVTPTVRFDVFPPESANFTGALQISPDGRKLAFLATQRSRLEAGARIWVRPIDSSENRQAEGTHGLVA